MVDQLNINDWVRGLKAAAGLPYGVDNLGSVYDVAYLFGVNNYYNAQIDFVTGTKKAREVGSSTLQFSQWQGVYSGTSNNSTALSTGWMVNSALNASPLNHHLHISLLRSRDTSSTWRVAGMSGYILIPLQILSGTLRFRISHSGGLSNFNNDNEMGSYTVKRESNTLVSVQKNDSTKSTANRTHTGYEDLEFGVVGIIQGVDSANAGLSNTCFGSFTAGRGDIVDGALLNEADYQYFLKYGVNLKTYEGGFEPELESP